MQVEETILLFREMFTQILSKYKVFYLLRPTAEIVKKELHNEIANKILAFYKKVLFSLEGVKEVVIFLDNYLDVMASLSVLIQSYLGKSLGFDSGNFIEELDAVRDDFEKIKSRKIKKTFESHSKELQFSFKAKIGLDALLAKDEKIQGADEVFQKIKKEHSEIVLRQLGTKETKEIKPAQKMRIGKILCQEMSSLLWKWFLEFVAKFKFSSYGIRAFVGMVLYIERKYYAHFEEGERTDYDSK